MLSFTNERFIPCSECVKVAEVSLGDPIDIATLQRHFSLQVMGAERAPRRTADDRLLMIVAGMRHAHSDLTLAGIASRREQMRERTPRGNVKWLPSIVTLLQRAEKIGMAGGASDRQGTLP